MRVDVFFFSSRRRHTRCALVTGVQTCALPIYAADCTVWAIDRDPDAVAAGRALEKEYGGRLTVLHGRFGEMVELLHGAGVDRFDGVVLDLGVSSPQIDDAARGFSFRFDGPLDMRMDRDSGETGPSAAEEIGRAHV